jgi:hypothetical protein
MAFRHGKNAALTLNSKDLSAFLTSLDPSWDLDMSDTTTFGATWKSAVAGVPGGKFDIAGHYDPTATTGPAAVLWAAFTGGVPVTGLIYPGGNVSGQALWTITSGCLVTAYSESSPVGGVVTFKASVAVVVLPVRTVVGA